MSPAGWYTFEVIDNKAMKQYFIGKTDRTVQAFDEWVNTPNVSMRDIEEKHGVTSLTKHSRNLQRIGALKKTLTSNPQMDRRNATKARRVLIRKLLREAPLEKLDEILKILGHNSPTKETEK